MGEKDKPERADGARVSVVGLREQLFRLSKLAADLAEKTVPLPEATADLTLHLVEASAAAFSAAVSITNSEAKAMDVGRGLRHDDTIR